MNNRLYTYVILLSGFIIRHLLSRELVGMALVTKHVTKGSSVSRSFNSIRQFKCCTSHTRWSVSVLKVGIGRAYKDRLACSATVKILA